MDEATERRQRQQHRRKNNEEFLERLYERRPDLKAAHRERTRRIVTGRVRGILREAADEIDFAVAAEEVPNFDDLAFETIVLEERPVLFLQSDWINTTEVTLIGTEAKDLVEALDARSDTFRPLMPLIGRIDATNFPSLDYVGTGWFVASDVLVTNRHVASLIAQWDGRRFAFSRGVGGNAITSSVCTAHEFDDLAPDQTRMFEVDEVLYIEPESSPIDIAFLRVRRRTDGTRPDHIEVARTDVGPNVPVFVVGYPARASRRTIPDQELMKELYRDRYDVKRASPGYTMPTARGSTRHDCTTLGGNSGSVVLDLNTGKAVGLHFAGLYQESNYAVRASVLADYIDRKRWTVPRVETTPGAIGTPAASVPSSATFTVPLTISVSIGTPTQQVQVTAGAGIATAVNPATVEAAAKDFWDQRPEGVIAVRVGFNDDGDTIGDIPIIAASVPADRLAAVQATGPRHFQTFEVRYFPADVTEQIEALAGLESVDSIAYDDNARTGAAFSFATVEEEMSVRAHVGPEYSWDELKDFLSDARDSLVGGIYEFHGSHIAKAIQERLEHGVSVQLVMDNSTFIKVRDEEQEFDRIELFRKWSSEFGDRFRRVIAPEGTSGLISDSYHIKVTVRPDDVFWLSSGNWKMSSSQPVITQRQRDEATDTDLPGNREWHVVVKSPTLAGRFRKHIAQDFERCIELGAAPEPRRDEAAEVFVDIPLEETLVEERRAPGRVLKPKTFRGRIKVKPLLTPDKEGAVYSEAVLDLIRSARKSLLFQIPYIGMPPNPRSSRGFIDELIKALTEKLKTLDDARVILRVGGSKFSAPTHAAWFFKARRVKIQERVRQIEDHHTKGMIVDGKRVLVGSHNWSKPGVTLNRDASLIFHDERIAKYFTEAFEIDWARANPIRPKRFVRPTDETVILEATGSTPPVGYQRVRLSEVLKEDD